MDVRTSERGEYVVTTTVLDRETCLRLLARARFGRVGFADDVGPHVLPVNCSLRHGDVVFRTESSSRLGRLADGRDVVFEVDHLDQVREAGWSVVGRGTAHRIDEPDEVAEVAELDLHPWAAGEHDRWVRIRTGEITGRMIERHRRQLDGATPYMPPD